MESSSPPGSHPLIDALRAAGLSARDASGYLARARKFGQVGFARGPNEEAALAQLKAARSALIESAKAGLSEYEMNDSILRALSGDAPQEGAPRASPISTATKRALAQKWIGENPSAIARILKDNDFDRDEIVNLLSGADLRDFPIDTFERAAFIASGFSGTPPSILDGSSPDGQESSSMDPDSIEEALGPKAGRLLERFGLSNIRIGGLPSMERAQATLDSLESALAEIAKQTGLPEKAIGLGEGWTIFANADVGHGSGYCSSNTRSICLSEDNGWRTLAHEWFHGFDFQAANALGIELEAIEHAEKADISAATAARSASDDESWIARRLASMRQRRGSQEAAADLREAAGAVIGGLRRSPKDKAIESILAEQTAESIERLRSGLFERFYRSRVTPGLEEAADRSFRELSQELLAGRAELADIAKWRKAHLGDKADMCKHYDAFVMAEKTARDSRAGEQALSLDESAMQRFTRIADERLAQASGDQSWNGYSTSAAEMSARGFEGNCFLDTPDGLRPYLTDGTDGSMYWPVASERGAHRHTYRAFFAAGARAMAEGGVLPATIFDGFESAASASTSPPLIDFGDKLSKRKAAAAQDPAAQTLKT